MKYFIKSYFSPWREVTKQQAEEYLKGFMARCPTITPEIIARHYREEKE